MTAGESHPADIEGHVVTAEPDEADPHGAVEAYASHGDVARPEQAHPVSWHPEVVDGPLSTRSLLRLEEALRQADSATGLTFSVYIGELVEPVRADAETMHARLADPDRGPS